MTHPGIQKAIAGAYEALGTAIDLGDAAPYSKYDRALVRQMCDELERALEGAHEFLAECDPGKKGTPE